MATIKQELAVAEIIENRGIPVGEAMVKAGYSQNSAINPKNLTDSDGYKELMKKYLPDDLLAKKHLELLNKQEVIAKNNNTTGQIDIIPTGQMDVTAVAKALDMAYKIKGSYADPKVNMNPGTVNVTFINSPEVQKIIHSFEDQLKQQLTKTP